MAGNAYARWLARLARVEACVRRGCQLAYWRWQAWCIRSTIAAYDRDLAHNMALERALPKQRTRLLNERIERKDELAQVQGHIDALRAQGHAAGKMPAVPGGAS